MLSFLLLRMRLIFSPTARVNSMTDLLSGKTAMILDIYMYIVDCLPNFVKKMSSVRPQPRSRTED